MHTVSYVSETCIFRSCNEETLCLNILSPTSLSGGWNHLIATLVFVLAQCADFFMHHDAEKGS